VRGLAGPPEPPEDVRYRLEEASRYSLRLSAVEDEIRPMEAAMVGDPLRATEAAKRLGISTKDLLSLVQQRKIRYVMLDGIAHVPVEAVEEYRARAS
jgi:excisionase family DNA binding protein